MDNFDWKANEDAILQAQHPMYMAAMSEGRYEEDYEERDWEEDEEYYEPYDPDGGFLNEDGEWERYDDMEVM